MTEDNLISKKELLARYNISYGALYRWKRKGLIPDEWFIKQAVSTGQETYFKKDLIIPRINKILELKDNYQLDELKAFLNPNLSQRDFTMRDLILIDEIDPIILKQYAIKKNIFNIYDAIIIYIFSINQELIDFSKYIDYDFSKINSINATFLIVKFNGNKIIISTDEVVLDNDIEIIKKYKFEDIASIIAKNI